MVKIRQRRNWGAKTNAALIFASIATVPVVAALVTALIDPPALGWVGFAIVSALVVGLGVAATLMVPRMRVSPARPAAASDDDWRLLVVADAYCDEDALRNEIQARLDGAVAVHLVVPVRVSHLHFLANDEAEERRVAEDTMLITVGLLRQSGIRATGNVGSDKPLESMTDALATFPATRVLLALPPAEESYWLERDLLPKARALTDLPVTQATVTSTQPADSSRREPSGGERARQTAPMTADQTHRRSEGEMALRHDRPHARDSGAPATVAGVARMEGGNVMTTAATSFEQPRIEIGRAAPRRRSTARSSRLGTKSSSTRACGSSSTCAHRS